MRSCATISSHTPHSLQALTSNDAKLLFLHIDENRDGCIEISELIPVVFSQVGAGGGLPVWRGVGGCTAHSSPLPVVVVFSQATRQQHRMMARVVKYENYKLRQTYQPEVCMI